MTRSHPVDAPLPAAPEDAAWMAAACPVDSFLCDAFFRIAESVYTGPENGMTAEEWQARRIFLPPLDLPCRLPGRVATADLPGREEALAGHYAGLIQVAEAHGRMSALARPFPYFAVASAIVGHGKALASCPWDDTLPAAVKVLEALAGTAGAVPGTVVWDDEDQGWHLRIVGAGPEACFVEWDAEGPPPVEGGFRVEAAALARQAAGALKRLRAVHDRLTHLLGRDLWC